MKLFAGPCSLESKELCFEVAETIRDNLPSGIDYYFKTSFAKENRSSSTSFMGHGIDYAKDVFTYLRADGYKIITDVHETWQVEDITAATIDDDFARNPRIHGCWRITAG